MPRKKTIGSAVMARRGSGGVGLLIVGAVLQAENTDISLQPSPRVSCELLTANLNGNFWELVEVG